MKLEQQVLTIEQVQELQELGFDVEKYASITKFSCENCENFGDCAEEIGSDIYMDINYVCDSIKGYKTLTIGDIIDILPKQIFNKSINYESHLAIDLSNKLISICYLTGSYMMLDNFRAKGDIFIDVLFQTLKWCIKEKHIKL